MQTILTSIVNHPGRWVVGFLVAVVALASLPVRLLEPWWTGQSPEWGRSVFQFAGVALVVVFGVIPIAKWYEDQRQKIQDQVQKIVDNKPIVVTDCLHDGRYQIHNLGDAPAINVWLVTGHQAAVPLGALDAHESRELPASVVTLMKSADRHMLLAFARADIRPYTPTFNVRHEPWGTFTHGFRRLRVSEESLRRGGSVQEYLNAEGAALLEDLDKFSA